MAFDGSARAVTCKAGVVPVFVQCALPVNDLIENDYKEKNWRSQMIQLQSI